jgi:hypothetical protein
LVSNRSRDTQYESSAGSGNATHDFRDGRYLMMSQTGMTASGARVTTHT